METRNEEIANVDKLHVNGDHEKFFEKDILLPDELSPVEHPRRSLRGPKATRMFDLGFRSLEGICDRKKIRELSLHYIEIEFMKTVS